MHQRLGLLGTYLAITIVLATRGSADELDKQLLPIVDEYCIHCHDASDPSGQIDLESWFQAERLTEDLETLSAVYKVLKSGEMPPIDEAQPSSLERDASISAIQVTLRQLAADRTAPQLPLRRLNRFQYNNAVRDLFGLNRDVFPLTEKLMTRYTDYVGSTTQELPESIEVASHALAPLPGLSGVKPFPKDLRASHGFDNQANQLTLSPLLLDALLRVAVSITESPDFNASTVARWEELFQAPSPMPEPEQAFRSRLAPLIRQAFRGDAEQETVDRYVAYAVKSYTESQSFEDAMRATAAAILSSPRFFFVAESGAPSSQAYELATRLSLFLWSSIPDPTLLDLASDGSLAEPVVLEATVDRMMSDPKIERFLDSFPAQWMQLENVLAATPDPARNRWFSIDATRPASLQMILEPLLIFDTAFLENQPLRNLISPERAYRSELLNDWYTTTLTPPLANRERIDSLNQDYARRREMLSDTIEKLKIQRADLVDPVRESILAKRNEAKQSGESMDLMPVAAWEFDGDLTDSFSKLDLEARGEIRFDDGAVVLQDSFLISEALNYAVTGKTLEVTFKLDNLDQAGGGLMGTQGPGDFFDTIVLGERQARHWISGSNGFSRTDDFAESQPETSIDEFIHLVMVYELDGTTRLYRNGEPYGKPFKKNRATFPKEETSIIFGLRHLPPGGNRYLDVTIDNARFYDRPLTPEEVQWASAGNAHYVTRTELQEAMPEQTWAMLIELETQLGAAEEKLNQVPATIDFGQAQQRLDQQFEAEFKSKLASRRFRREAMNDPRYGGIITNAAIMSMTSGPDRTHPIARGAWIIEVILNDPPPPPPNDVPPLNEDAAEDDLTIREKFAAHRANPDCAGCHSKLDPLGFALENFDLTGRWRDQYENGRDVDSSGKINAGNAFQSVIEFKAALVSQEQRFAEAFAAHLLRFALARELEPLDLVEVEKIAASVASEGFPVRSMVRGTILNGTFVGPQTTRDLESKENKP